MTYQTILSRWGPVLDTRAMAEALGYPSAHAVRSAIARGYFPVRVIRRGRRIVASAESVAEAWNG